MLILESDTSKLITFKHGNREKTINIEDENFFNKLNGADFSDLLYYDSNYIRWMDARHLKKMNGDDIVNTLLNRPELFDYFVSFLNKVSTEDFILILTKYPELIKKVKYINYKIYEIMTNE